MVRPPWDWPFDQTGGAVAYKDLRDFLKKLEKEGELRRISAEVDPILEITEIAPSS